MPARSDPIEQLMHPHVATCTFSAATVCYYMTYICVVQSEPDALNLDSVLLLFWVFNFAPTWALCASFEFEFSSRWAREGAVRIGSGFINQGLTCSFNSCRLLSQMFTLVFPDTPLRCVNIRPVSFLRRCCAYGPHQTPKLRLRPSTLQLQW